MVKHDTTEKQRWQYLNTPARFDVYRAPVSSGEVSDLDCCDMSPVARYQASAAK
jgi:hypothetical protein